MRNSRLIAVSGVLFGRGNPPRHPPQGHHRRPDRNITKHLLTADAFLLSNTPLSTWRGRLTTTHRNTQWTGSAGCWSHLKDTAGRRHGRSGGSKAKLKHTIRHMWPVPGMAVSFPSRSSQPGRYNQPLMILGYWHVPTTPLPFIQRQNCKALNSRTQNPNSHNETGHQQATLQNLRPSGYQSAGTRQTSKPSRGRSRRAAQTRHTRWFPTTRGAPHHPGSLRR